MQKYPNICIIGCGGVGKAHALSAVKYLKDVHLGKGTIHLVDTSYDVLKPFLSNVWENAWGPISDKIDISGTHVKTTLNQVTDHGLPIDSDLYIIASPNNTHLDYLNELKDKVVICEKPLVSYEDPIPLVSRNVHYGIEWCYHPMLQDISEIRKIQFVHGWAPPQATIENKWQVYDLGSHILGLIMMVNGGLGDIEEVKTYRQITAWKVGGAHCFCGYDSYVQSDKIIINDTVELDWIPFEQGDLFYEQIAWALDGWSGKGFGPMFSPGDIIEQMNTLKEIRSRA